MESKDQHELYEKTRKRVQQKKRLYYHFVLFLVGSVFLVALNIFFKVGSQFGEWFKYAVALWLVVWILHFVNVFITNRFFGKDWERIETEKLIQRHEKKLKSLEGNLIKKGLISPDSPLPASEKKKKKRMITMIAAIGNNGELGKNNALLWHLPNDLKRFKQITSGHDVLMGRKTFESLGKPLPNRKNIVITRNLDYLAPGCEIAHSLNDALDISQDTQPFILGGAEIYKQAIEFADILDLTLVDTALEADAFFPQIDVSKWREIERQDFQADDRHQYNYSFVKYERIIFT